MKVITQSQLMKYFAVHVFATIIAIFIGFVMNKGGFNAPLAVLLGAVLGLMITFIAFRLAIRRPDEHFVDYGKAILSKWVHYPLLLIIVINNIVVISINLWELQDFLTQFYLIRTPSWLVVSACCVCIAYTARFGIKSVFRTAEGVFFLAVFGMLLIPLLIGQNMQWFMIRGFVTQFDFSQAWDAGVFLCSIFGEMTLLIFIIPYVQHAQKSMKSILFSTITIVVIVIVHASTLILTLGPEMAKNLNFPELEVIRLIKSGSFLETFDPALIALWLLSIFVKLSFNIFIVAHVVSHVFKLKHYKPIVFPITALACVSTICLAYSHSQYNTLMNGGMVNLILFAESIPLIYFVVDSIKRYFTNKGMGEQL